MRPSKFFLMPVLLCAIPALALTPEDLGFEASNKLTCKVAATATLLPGGEVQYTYALSNSSASLQPISNWALQIDSAVAESDRVAPASPLKWAVGGCCIVDNARKNATGIRVATWVLDANEALIQPGVSLSGFGVKARSLPAIKRFFVEGFTQNDIPDGEFSEEELHGEVGELVDFFNNTFSGHTLGPDAIPEVITPEALIERLIALKHQAASLDWFFGPGAAGIVKSLDAKLNAAKDSAGRGNKAAAANQLGAFINELNAQKGKHLNDNAYFLLKPNAQFIIGKLNP